MDYETNKIISQEELNKMGEELSNYAESLINQQFKKISNDMDYEKKYKEAFKWIESLYPKFSHEQQMEAEAFFPELKESEDERIRKSIHIYLDWLDGRKDYAPRGEYSIRDMISWLEKQGEPQDKGEISDGYHTFNELYYYRMLYNAAFFNMLPKEWVHKSKRHNDGEECFGGGWFIVMANLPTGQISNHYELKDWDLFQIPEKEVADKWDGHTPQEAADRLHKYLLEKRGEQKPAWSEEDDMMIEETLYFLREYQQSNRCKDESGMQNSVTCEKWLKSLKERINGKQ